MTAFTAQVLDPGSSYYDERRQRLIRVPAGHHAIRCMACSWSVNIPARQGRDRAEQLRRDHLLSTHLTQLNNGTVVLTEIPPLFTAVPSSSGSEVARSPSARGTSVGCGGERGTTEQMEALTPPASKFSRGDIPASARTVVPTSRTG